MASPIFVLGGFQTDFARNLAREGHGIDALFGDVITGALDATRLDPSDVETIHVGNAFGELFNGQGHLGAMPATVIDAFSNTPAMRHEAACASGGVATLAAMSELEAGRYACALVIGVEQERNVPGDIAAQHMGSAAWVGHEAKEARFVWPHMFSQVMDAYRERHGLTYAHLAALARKSFANARTNPNAQGRSWRFEEADFAEDDVRNPVVEGGVRRRDCSQVTDGAAAVLLCSADFAAAWAQRTSKVPSHVLGWGHRTASLSLSRKLAKSNGEPYVFPHIRGAITDAFHRAQIPDVTALSGIEVHDCFSITEYMAIDHFGITPPGKSYEAIESGQLLRGGKTPVNPSGGLIGGGHPVGATGVRMLLDAHKQVTGTAGGYQVEGAHTFATLNIGGAAATSVSFVVGRQGL